MKTKKINKKLSLNKETIKNLGETEVKAIKGGFETNRIGLACMGDPNETMPYYPTCDYYC